MSKISALFRKILLSVIVAIVLSGCAALAESGTSFKTVPAVFQPILHDLQNKTAVPVQLPTFVPTDALITDPDSRKTEPYIAVPIQNGRFKSIYAYPTVTRSDRYTIALQALPSPGCRGASNCSFGDLTGERLTKQTPSLREQFKTESAAGLVYISPESFSTVELSNQIKGIFVPYRCYANCGTSRIAWDSNGNRHSVGIRYGSKQTMIRMANSQIENVKTAQP